MIQLVRKPAPWPNGARVAVSISFDVDVDSILHLAFPETSYRMAAAQSLLRYERVAVKRIVDIFAHFGLKQTLSVPAW